MSAAFLFVSIGACAASPAGPSSAPPQASSPAGPPALDGIWRSDAYRIDFRNDETLSLHERRPCPKVPCVSGVGSPAVYAPEKRTLTVKSGKSSTVYGVALDRAGALVLTSPAKTILVPRWAPPALPGTTWSGPEWALRFEAGGTYQRVHLPSCEHKELAECNVQVLERGSYRTTTWDLTLVHDGRTDVYAVEWPDSDLLVVTLDDKTSQLNLVP